MVTIQKKLILNDCTFLRFKVINKSMWTKVFLVTDSEELYLGSELYGIIYKRLYDGFFSEPKNDRCFDFEGYQYMCPLVLTEPYICVCRTLDKKNFSILFLGDYLKKIGEKIIVDSKLMHFE